MQKRKNNKYIVMSIDSMKLLACAKKISPQRLKERKANDQIEFEFVVKEGKFRTIVAETNHYMENSLFEQMRFYYEENDKNRVNNNDEEIQEQMLMDSIFILDFTEVFAKRINREIIKEKKENKKGVNTKKMEALFQNGFTVEFVEKKHSDDMVDNSSENPGVNLAETKVRKFTKTYVPFESSASMTRACTISFIDKAIKEEISERLMLGMDLTLGKSDPNSFIKVKPHKYFAYRGLCMTSGTPVRTDNFILNEQSVIVLPDDSHTFSSKLDINENVAIQKKGEDTLVSVLTNKKDDKGEFYFYSGFKKIKLNGFDGEGLISSKYAELISDFFDKKGMSSFQVRMPFVKGMLHKVDYHKFLDGELTELNEKLGGKFIVKDVWGIERDLRKAEIILTQSMLKNCDWLTAYVKAMNLEDQQNELYKDPMKFYFTQFQKYNHALYVALTNLNLHNDVKEIQLNYQSINTLNLSNEKFIQLINSYSDRIQEIKNNKLKQREVILGKDKTDQEPFWKHALSRNSELINESFITGQVNALIDSYIDDIIEGRIHVTGENRFLSGDLLALMIHILKQHVVLKNKDNEQKTALDMELADLLRARIKELQAGSHIFTDNFYMPSNQMTLRSNDNYVILRNPHLSSNEDCLALPYLPKKDTLYSKYLSHLDGVIMVAYESLIPNILGGADFDGDMVRIYDESCITEAIRQTKKIEAEKKLGPDCDTETVRKPQMVFIDTNKENNQPVPRQVTFDYVKDTYGNQIGQISNAAIRLGEMQGQSGVFYSPAHCTLLTGLEIDAAKTGVHPVKQIESIRSSLVDEENKCAQRDYLVISEEIINNNKIKYYSKSFTESALKDNEDSSKKTRYYRYPDGLKIGTIKYVLRQNVRKQVNYIAYIGEDNEIKEVPNLELLPQLYVDNYIKIKQKKSEKKNSDAKENVKKKEKQAPLIFKTKKTWNSILEKHLLSEKGVKSLEQYSNLLALLSAYDYYITRYQMLNRIKRNHEEMNYIGMAYTLLNEQYDSIYSKFACGKNRKKALTYEEHFLNICDKLFEQDDSALTASVEKLVSHKWSYAEANNRATVLMEILPKGVTLTEEEKAILCNFEESGYLLLFYLLMDGKNHLETLDTIDLESADDISRVKGEMAVVEEIVNLKKCDNESEQNEDDELSGELENLQQMKTTKRRYFVASLNEETIESIYNLYQKYLDAFQNKYQKAKEEHVTGAVFERRMMNALVKKIVQKEYNLIEIAPFIYKINETLFWKIYDVCMRQKLIKVDELINDGNVYKPWDTKEKE